MPDSFLDNGSVNKFPLLGSRFLIMEELDFNNGRVVFCTWSMPRHYKQRTRSVVSSVLQSVKRILGGCGLRISTVRSR
jgi:hypothetical protein